MDDLSTRVQDVIRQVFGDPEMVLRDETAIVDVPGWDSMTHINLMIAVEQRFAIKIAAAEMSRLKGGGRSVGTLVALVGEKLRSAS